MSQPDNLTILEERVAAHPDSLPDVRALADAYSEHGRWNDAVEAYWAAIALDPTNADLCNSLGAAYEGAGDPAQAEDAYQKAVALQPEDAVAYYNLGSLYEEQRRIPEAIQAFKKCLRYATDPDEYPDVKQKLSAMMSGEMSGEWEDEEQDVPPQDARQAAVQKAIARMYERIRSWAITSLLWGGLSIFASGTLDPVWGIVMIVIAILSWKVKVPAMFIVYGAFMGWAAVMNGLAVLSGGSVTWLLMAALQAYWTYSIVKEFKVYRQLPLQELFDAGVWPAHLPPPQPEPVITGRFAVGGAILAATSLILVPTVFLADVALMMLVGPTWASQLLSWMLSGSIDLAVLALGLCGAALMSKTERKVWAVGGVVISALVLIGWLLFLILLRIL
jgi:tetratricopeptide (TPR) repeat protein